MMKSLQLRNSLLIFGLFVMFVSCEEECFDISELDKYTAITKDWIVEGRLGNQIITDINGISQTLIVSSRDSIYWNDTAEDYCGNIYGSFYHSIQYNTSLSPLNFMFTLHGGSDLKDEFYLEILITNTNNASDEHKSTSFNFYTEKSSGSNSTISYLEQITIFGKRYSGVLKIVFHDTFSEHDVETLYYAKKYGLIKFIEKNGNEFAVNN